MGHYISEEEELNIIDDYFNGMNINKLSKKHRRDIKTIKRILKEFYIPLDLNSRFNQKYIASPCSDNALIKIKKGDNHVYAMIDKEDMERCKELGIWSLTAAGYVINCKNNIYLHRFILNAEKDIEVDHINHNLLDNRKKNLRLASSKEQKFNTKLRVDNKSGHRGIYWDKERSKWHVNIKNGDKRIRKRFDDFDEAVKFVDGIFEKWHKEFLYEKSIAH